MEPFLDHFIAHRGYYDPKLGIAENSLAAFFRAVESGYGIELDVALSKDGIPVVFHDESLKRMCDKKGSVYSYTYKELQKLRLKGTDACIPAFEDVLKAVDGRVPLVVEIKSEGDWQKTCQRAAGLLDAYKGPFCVESFSPLAVRWFRKNRPDWVRGQLAQRISDSGKTSVFVQFALEQMLLNFLSRPDFIAYEYTEKTPFVVGAFKRLCPSDFRVVWTIRSQQQLDLARRNYQIFIFEGFRPE